MSPSRPPQRRLLDAEELRRELHGYRSDWEDPPTRAQLVESALPRITGVLELLPDADPESRLLELGAAPFLGSQCVARVWPGELMLASYSGTGETRGSQRLLSLEGKPDKVFTFDCFNVETDEFPYPDEHFDVVIFSELIEHLGLNPVWALSEIHRVLKRGGHAIISTPNALSLERLSTYLRGGSEMVDRYAPLLGYGARHNREWHPAELRELLESTGFEIETLVVRDLGERPLKERLRRALAKRVLRLWSAYPRDSHIFLRARRRDVFRWHFPPRLYDHMEMYHVARHPFVDMGANDAIQCGGGWLPLEEGPDAAGPVRRVSGSELHAKWMEFATAFLRGRAGALRVVVRMCAAGVEMASGVVRVRTGGDLLAAQPFTVRCGEWTDLAVPLSRPAVEREELVFELEVPRGSGVAVRRVWLDGERAA